MTDTGRSSAASGPNHPPQSSIRPPTIVYFEYVGSTALTVIGPITARRYRFPKPGATLAVDGRDAPSLAIVPHLQQTRRP